MNNVVIWFTRTVVKITGSEWVLIVLVDKIYQIKGRLIQLSEGK